MLPPVRALRAALIELDQNLLQQIQGQRKAKLNRIMQTVTHLGDPQGWAAVAVGLILSGEKGEKLVRDITPSIVASVAASYALKVTFGRPRPRVGIGNIEALARDPDKYSFPSAHAASSTAAAVQALLVNPQAGGPLLGLALMISFSRMYVGVHYPLDVIAGMLTGTLTSLLRPAWQRGLVATGQTGARAIRAVWLRGRAVDQGLPPEDLQQPRASVSQ